MAIGDPQEFFLGLVVNFGPDKIVKAFRHDDLSDWCVHGDALREPFALVSKRAARWRVTHIKTTRTLSFLRPLAFRHSFALAGHFDKAVEGMSQVEHRDGNELVGWDRSMMLATAQAALSRHEDQFPVLANEEYVRSRIAAYQSAMGEAA